MTEEYTQKLSEYFAKEAKRDQEGEKIGKIVSLGGLIGIAVGTLLSDNLLASSLLGGCVSFAGFALKQDSKIRREDHLKAADIALQYEREYEEMDSVGREMLQQISNQIILEYAKKPETWFGIREKYWGGIEEGTAPRKIIEAQAALNMNDLGKETLKL